MISERALLPVLIGACVFGAFIGLNAGLSISAASERPEPQKTAYEVSCRLPPKLYYNGPELFCDGTSNNDGSAHCIIPESN